MNDERTLLAEVARLESLLAAEKWAHDNRVAEVDRLRAENETLRAAVADTDRHDREQRAAALREAADRYDVIASHLTDDFAISNWLRERASWTEATP